MRPGNMTNSRPIVEPSTVQHRETFDLTEDGPEGEPEPMVQAQEHAVQRLNGSLNGEANGGANGELNGEPNERQISREERRSTTDFLQSPSPDIMSPMLAEATFPRETLIGSMSSSALQLQNGGAQPVSNYASQWPARSEEIPSPVQTNISARNVSGPPLVSPTFTMSNGQAEMRNHRPSVPAQFPVPGPAHTIHPPKRQRTQAPVMPSLAPRIALIDAHIASVGGEMNLNTGLERPRFMLLKDACSKEDGFYVATHQIFCAWDVNPRQVLEIIGFPPHDTLKVAFKILGQLIRDNSQLAPNHLFWFSQFPSPLPDLLRNSEPYRRTVHSVGKFLTRLGVDWVQFANDTRARSYPPLVDELVNRLGILSPIFQGIVFTATRRNLGVVDDAVGDKMEKMFLKDRQEHQALSARVNTNRPPTEREISDRNGRFAGEYHSLLRQVRRRQSSIVSSTGSLTRAPTPGNAHLPPGSSPGMNPNIQRLQQPSPFLSNPGSASASPDMMGNGQQDVIGPPWRTSAASPNIGMAAHDFGRPPALNSPQLSLHTNSPSPNMIQNAQFQAQQHIQTPVVRSNDNLSPMQNNQQWGPPGSGHVSNQGYNTFGGQRPPNQYPQAMPQGSGQAISGQNQVNPSFLQQTPPNVHPLVAQLNNIAQELFCIAETRQQRSGLSGQDPPHYEQSVINREQFLLQEQAQLRQAISQSQVTGQATNSSYQTTYQHSRNPSSVYMQNPPTPQVAAQQQYRGGPGPSAQLSQYPRPNVQVAQSFNNMPQHQRNSSASAASRSRGPGPIMNPRVVSNQATGFAPPQAMNPTGQPQPVLSEGAQRMLKQTEVYNQTPILQQTVVPPYYYPLAPGIPAPHFTALHQAHLRSPPLAPCRPIPKDMPLDDPDRRFYQVIKGFAYPPVKLLASHAIATFEFAVAEEDFPMIARNLPTAERAPEIRGFVPGSLQYRMRCVERKKPDGDCSISEWVLQDTSWPDNGVYQLEAGMTKQQIELRRKRLHGKDLPVDLTAYVALFEPTVKIKITMSMPGRRNNLREKNYYFAIEVIEIMAHKQIMDLVQRRRKAAKTTKDSIKQSLAGSGLEDDDDDIALVSSELTLDITDPFSARMFKTPVRGGECQHRECFDLETYLLSRNSKPNRKGQPSMVDIWKCPLCKADARPQMLYVDEYLMEIRDTLERQGLMDIKSVLVDMNGDWKPKALTISNGNGKRKTMNDEDDSEDEEDDIPMPKRNHGRTRSIASAAAVIDLSD